MVQGLSHMLRLTRRLSQCRGCDTVQNGPIFDEKAENNRPSPPREQSLGETTREGRDDRVL
jgi:hypothetical protein